MAIKAMANCGDQVLYTAEELGAVLRTFTNNSDYIIKGIGNEMSMAYSSSSLQVTVRTGEAIMCGRFIMVKSNESVNLPANTTGKLVLRIDLTKPITKEGVLTYVTGNQKADNLNNLASGQYDMLLAEFVTNSSGVSSLTDKRDIRETTSPPTPPTPPVPSGLVKSIDIGAKKNGSSMLIADLSAWCHDWQEVVLGYTATEDCYVVPEAMPYGRFTLDGFNLEYNTGGNYPSYPILMKKGSRVEITSASNNNTMRLKVMGIKTITNT